MRGLYVKEADLGKDAEERGQGVYDTRWVEQQELLQSIKDRASSSESTTDTSSCR